jgi:hypothetical protein
VARRRRAFSVFNLSFLDIMSCGFGAVILFFMIISAQISLENQERLKESLSEIERLEARVSAGERQLALLRNSLSDSLTERAGSRAMAEELAAAVRDARANLSERERLALTRREDVQRLQAELRELEAEAERLARESVTAEEAGRQIRAVSGDGERAYLTGMRMGGERVLILVDVSASMLDTTLVNVIRRRNMPFERKVTAPKWQRVMATVDWLSAQIPETSEFQIYLFNTRAWPLVEGSDGQWLSASGDVGRLDEAIRLLRQADPGDGSSLHSAFEVIRDLSPRADNVYLITDSLPTQGATPPARRTVSGADRLRHFERALRILPTNVPVNVILFPLEGDPRAAPAFWEMTLRTGGTFMAPTEDWP